MFISAVNKVVNFCEPRHMPISAVNKVVFLKAMAGINNSVAEVSNNVAQ
jgi:hypothetical protein